MLALGTHILALGILLLPQALVRFLGISIFVVLKFVCSGITLVLGLGQLPDLARKFHQEREMKNHGKYYVLGNANTS
jgi:hypothetical protein